MVFEHGSEFISNNILNNFLKLINENFNTEGENFGKFIVETYMKIITKPNLADVTIKMISWVFGEIGSIICMIEKKIYIYININIFIYSYMT